MQTKIGIKSSNTTEIALSLNRLLADEHILYIKTRNAHWNVEGPDFLPAHRFFEEQYKELETIIDDIAERIRSVGHFPEASMTVYLRETRLSEETREENTSRGFIKMLLKDHESIIIHLRESIGSYEDDWNDVGTADFATGLLQAHEKMAWMLRAHLR